ncbi:MAG TPA: hypothetical protein DCS93_18655 [Microscillaceae bacterium]|nr:hypothetical protein [Microscillaceae bacterium]
MKTTHTYLTCLVILSVMILGACNNKTDDGPNEASLLTAKGWTIKTVIDQTNSNTDVTNGFSGKTAQFNSDGTYSHNLGSVTESGSYVFGGNTVTLTPGSGTPYTASLTEVSVTSTQLTFKVTLNNEKTGSITYAFTME